MNAWRNVRNLFPLAAILCVLQVQAAPAANPCETPEHRAFDFWLGTWDVTTPDGKLAGQNKIEREENGCIVHERYTTPGAFTGQSLNAYDSTRKLWHQTWIDNTGAVLLLDGGMQGKSMVLQGNGVSADGKPVKHRISWTPNPDGTVRQHWEMGDAKGGWTTAFDGSYKRK